MVGCQLMLEFQPLSGASERAGVDWLRRRIRNEIEVEDFIDSIFCVNYNLP